MKRTFLLSISVIFINCFLLSAQRNKEIHNTFFQTQNSFFTGFHSSNLNEKDKFYKGSFRDQPKGLYIEKKAFSQNCTIKSLRNDSLFKNSYKSWEIWLSEALYINTAYKLGMKNLYGIVGLSGVPFGIYPKWAPIIGLGSEFEIGSKYLMDIDAMAFQISDDEPWTSELNMLNQLRIVFGKKNIEYDIYLGPTINLLISRFENENDTLGSNIAPWNFYDKTYVKGGSNPPGAKPVSTRFIMWLGINLGLKVHPVKNLQDYGW